MIVQLMREEHAKRCLPQDEQRNCSQCAAIKVHTKLFYSHSDNCSHPPPPARACPHATCRMPLRHLVQLCSGLHPAPESSAIRGLVLVNATSGDLYQCPNGDQQLGSTAATTYVQEKVRLPPAPLPICPSRVVPCNLLSNNL